MKELEDLAQTHKISLAKIGTTGGDALKINDATISLPELSAAHTATIPALFG